MQALEQSIATDGWIGAITVAADGETFDGSARVEKTAENGMLDAAIVLDIDGTKPVILRRTDIPTATDPRAVRLGLAANRVASLNLEWEPDVLAEIAAQDIDLSELWTPEEWQIDAIPDVLLPAVDELQALKAQRNTAPAPDSPVDLIYTFAGGNGSCCIARAAGMQYGVRSTDACCMYCSPIFIDNHYQAYDHARHLAVVQQHCPKYATVRDVMTRAQCAEAGIAYYSFEQILAWAEELTQYAEHVIVIPKYDCLDQIPAHFMLGYSVPTSYGGTPLPITAFAGRQVHLLGGEPRLQVEYWRTLGSDVISIDNNYIQRKSQFGMVLTESFKWVQLYDYNDLGSLPNPWHVCLAINCGRMIQLFRQELPCENTV
jgi:hypothetical protein